MKRLNLVMGICILYLFVVFGGTALMQYFDNKFYGKVHAGENVNHNIEQNYDDSEWHYNAWMQWKAEIAEKAKHRIIFVFPDVTKKVTRLEVIHDPVTDMYCFVLKNRPYYFKTGLNCHPGWYIRGEHLK